jgi:hypothetical protein
MVQNDQSINRSTDKERASQTLHLDVAKKVLAWLWKCLADPHLWYHGVKEVRRVQTVDHLWDQQPTNHAFHETHHAACGTPNTKAILAKNVLAMGCHSSSFRHH